MEPTQACCKVVANQPSVFNLLVGEKEEREKKSDVLCIVKSKPLYVCLLHARMALDYMHSSISLADSFLSVKLALVDSFA